MSAMIDQSYLDFFAIAIDAYEIDNNTIYRKLMMTLIGHYQSAHKDIELSLLLIEREASLVFSAEALETFYEEIYDSIDIIKLYKSKLKAFENKEILFEDLHEIIDKVHVLLVNYLDRVSTLEVKAIQAREMNIA